TLGDDGAEEGFDEIEIGELHVEAFGIAPAGAKPLVRRCRAGRARRGVEGVELAGWRGRRPRTAPGVGLDEVRCGRRLGVRFRGSSATGTGRRVEATLVRGRYRVEAPARGRAEAQRETVDAGERVPDNRRMNGGLRERVIMAAAALGLVACGTDPLQGAAFSS